jgi:predicted ferric reductase
VEDAIMGPVPQRQDRFSSRWHKGLTGVGALFCVAAALMVPFAYPTQTLWYKTGMDKILLIAGQLMGLLAMVLLGGQIVLALRPIFLERLFGAALLMRWHRGNGVLATGLAFGHALLVLIPADRLDVLAGNDGSCGFTPSAGDNGDFALPCCPSV